MSDVDSRKAHYSGKCLKRWYFVLLNENQLPPTHNVLTYYEEEIERVSFSVQLHSIASFD